MARKRKRRSVTGSSRYSFLREYKGTHLDISNLPPLGAHSMGIGRKIVQGNATNTLALRVYVSRKLSEATLSSNTRVPAKVKYFSRSVAKELELPTDVIETPPPVFEAIDPTDRFRPAQGGISLGIPSVTAGTLGGWVWDLTDDTIVMLSNDHVIGDDAGVGIMQPGAADGGALPEDRLGETKRRIQRSATSPNTVDCAIGDLDDTSDYDPRVEEVGPAVFATRVAALDMAVEKYGRTTRHTFGEIQDVDWSGDVGGLSFEDCMFVEVAEPSADWSAGGDSGSLVFSRSTIDADSDIKPVVGLHFAGSGTSGIECKIQNVFTRLDLTTLCAGAFAAFIEALFETETAGELSEATEMRLRELSALAAGAPTFRPFLTVARDKRLGSMQRFHAGIARDMQARLEESRKGRMVSKFVDSYRVQLLTLLTKDRDVQRATIRALRPLVAGATTTTDVLGRVITDEDIQRLTALSDEVSRKADRKLKAALRTLQPLKSRASGKTLAAILEIKH